MVHGLLLQPAKNFLIEDIRVDRGRHLLLATKEQRKLLVAAKTWYVDATFRVVQRPFAQLLSVHALRQASAAGLLPHVTAEEKRLQTGRPI